MGTRRVSVKAKEARKVIVAELYRKGYSVRAIAKEVAERYKLKKPPSTATIFDDIQALLKEWRETRIEDIELAAQLELERIDDTIRELWDQWEKSKQDYSKATQKQIGLALKRKDDDLENEAGEKGRVLPYRMEQTKVEVVSLGNVSYISEIRAQLAERRKLLGLYAPEKKEITGKDGKDLMKYDLSKLTPEQRQALLAVGETILDDKN